MLDYSEIGFSDLRTLLQIAFSALWGVGQYYGICRRLKPECKLNKMLREDLVEEMIIAELKKLICPSPAIIDWVVSSMREQHKDSIAEREQMAHSLEGQIKRITTMDDNLYEDKLAGLISKQKYELKHEQFITEKMDYEDQLAKLPKLLGSRLEQRLSILELTPESFRNICSEDSREETSNNFQTFC